MAIRTSTTLKFESIWSICCLLLCILLLIFAIILIKRSSQPDLLLHAVSIASITAGILLCIWWSFMSNNWIYSLINTGQTCDLSFRFHLIVLATLYYSFCVFMLCQIDHLLNYLPPKYRHQVKDKSYKLAIYIVLLILFSVSLYIMYRSSATFEIRMATDDNQYKYCFFSKKTYDTMPIAMILCVSITSICILVTGVRFFVRIKSVGNDPNVSAFNKMEIEHFLWTNLVFVAHFFFMFIIDKVLHVSLFAQCGSLVVSVLIIWNVYRNYKHGLYDLHHLTHPASFIMNEPNRTLETLSSEITRTDDKINFDEFVAVTIAQTNFSMLPDEFVYDAKKLYHILIDIYNDDCCINICQEIAAFAATKYDSCIDCGNLLKLSECDEDYTIEFGVMSMVDEFQNTKYYINEFNDEKELLCRYCAIKHGIVSDFMLFPRLLRTMGKLRKQSDRLHTENA